RPKGKKELLSKNEFLYDEYFDCYICPQDQMLAFSTVTREGYREYKSNPDCRQKLFQARVTSLEQLLSTVWLSVRTAFFVG
ncbi:hypothetical protein BXA52_14960, partial [Enterococcus faecium]